MSETNSAWDDLKLSLYNAVHLQCNHSFFIVQNMIFHGYLLLWNTRKMN